MLINIKQIQLHKWFFIHFVWSIQISEKAVKATIGKNGNSGAGHMKVPEQLASVIDVERITNLLAFNKDLNLAPLQNGVVNLLPLLCPDVANVLRDHLGRIKNVIPKN